MTSLDGVIHPDAGWLTWWNLVILVIMLYSFLFLPYLIAFEDVTPSSSWFIVDIIVDALFLVDIFITANTAYYRGTQLVTSRKAILLNYLRGMLLVDCISTFPLYLIMLPWDDRGNKSNSLVRVLRITKLSKLFRATKAVKVLKFLSSWQTSGRFAELIKKHGGILRLTWTIHIIGIISHFTACMWYYSAKLEDFGPDTWIMRFNMQNESNLTLYLTSLYWAVTTVTTVGFGDIYAQTPLEIGMAIVWMLLGIGIYSFVMGSLSAVITSMDEDTAFLGERLQLVDLFAKDTGLLRKTVKDIMSEVSALTKGATLNEEKRGRLIEKMTRDLRQVVVRNMHDCAARRIELLSHLNSHCLQRLLPRMLRRKFQPQEAIYVQGDTSTHVYFVLEGRVRFVIASRKLVVKTVVAGGFFGETEILRNEVREYSAEAECECDVLLLRKDVFVEQMSRFPELDRQVREIAAVREERDHERLNELLDLIEIVEIRRATSYRLLAGRRRSAIRRLKLQLDLQTEGAPQGVSSESSLRATIASIRSSTSVVATQEIKAILQSLMPDSVC